MGYLKDGEWNDGWYDTATTGGRFERSTAGFRNWITTDGRAGPSGTDGFKAEADRYHLYVSYACPWAHRTLIFRALKGLDDLISVSAVHPDMLREGWTFATDFDGATGDDLFGFDYLREVYTKADPKVSGRVTVPILWDKLRGTIVSNESAEIIRMFNTAFNGLTGNTDDYYPHALRPHIDAINDRVYKTVNNGVYLAGFATTQAAYDEAIVPLFDSLEWIENLLEQSRYLTGDQITEADWRLFTTLIRFDKVYHGHFKCNLKRIVDYPNMWGYLRALYQVAGVKETVHINHFVRHYHYSHDGINPNRIVPITPRIDFDAPHGRGEI